MYIKPLEIPRHILAAQALDVRIPASHLFKEKISKRAANLLSGYKGENAMRYHLQFLPEDDFLIFHYIRLPDEYKHFQIDFLLLSRWFYLIIEVKNIYDNINFDDLGQTYRKIDDNVEVFTNPVEQINLQYRRLLSWLSKYDLPSVPIEKIVVYSRDDTYLRNLNNDKRISDIVMHRDKVLSKVDSFIDKHQTPRISEQQLLDLSWHLLNEHVPEKDGGMDQFNVNYDDLIKGVLCPDCGTVPMQWKSGKWWCDFCGCTSKTAHRQALMDYALLVGEHINNRQARDFLRVGSSYIAKDILQKENFEKIGSTSGRKYRIDLENLFKSRSWKQKARSSHQKSRSSQ
ncbi:nuclease-related domain-containing protein [Lentibacillus amyloliquefaciens]|uniref:NERD domain-containing protein n=1 Tax=Lentibacillus amyloliquefaciens TaxID=1472767 RepID=A0A0U3W6S8_9BACI|nr:nuclease-related domain-containing protein [Lentibacillus amyloliquefaciens]ALX48896.1 hypothetical protein AOX59_09880 [Lentibacillus amyloliquefaciens]